MSKLTGKSINSAAVKTLVRITVEEIDAHLGKTDRDPDAGEELLRDAVCVLREVLDSRCLKPECN